MAVNRRSQYHQAPVVSRVLWDLIVCMKTLCNTEKKNSPPSGMIELKRIKTKECLDKAIMGPFPLGGEIPRAWSGAQQAFSLLAGVL